MFKRGNANHAITLIDDAIAADKGINLAEGSWSIGVIGYEISGETLVKKITTNKEKIEAEGALDEDGDAFSSVTPTIAEQLIAEIENLNDALDGKATAEQGARADAAIANTADTYTAKPWTLGMYCIYSNVLYKCTTAIPEAEAWNAAHWTQMTVGEVLEALNAAKQDLIASPVNGNIATMNALGQTVNSGKKVTDFVAATEMLSADVEYWVNASTGSDANDGSSGAPFLTIQHALDLLPCILCGYGVTIHLTGAFSETLTISNHFQGRIMFYCHGAVTLAGSIVQTNSHIVFSGQDTPSFIATSSGNTLNLSNSNLGVLNGVTVQMITTGGSAAVSWIAADSLLYVEGGGYFKTKGGAWGVYTNASRLVSETAVVGENHSGYGFLSVGALIQMESYSPTNVAVNVLRLSGGLVKYGAGLDLT